MVIFPITRSGRVEKSQKKKKIFLKDVFGVCVGRCMCPRNHSGKKVICKK